MKTIEISNVNPVIRTKMDRNKVFEYIIPARLFMKNGGNIIQKEIVTEYNIDSTMRYRIQSIEGNGTILNLSTKSQPIKYHIDMCWVIADVLL